jgi:hypothetical protein
LLVSIDEGLNFGIVANAPTDGDKNLVSTANYQLMMNNLLQSLQMLRASQFDVIALLNPTVGATDKKKLLYVLDQLSSHCIPFAFDIYSTSVLENTPIYNFVSAVDSAHGVGMLPATNNTPDEFDLDYYTQKYGTLFRGLRFMEIGAISATFEGCAAAMSDFQKSNNSNLAYCPPQLQDFINKYLGGATPNRATHTSVWQPAIAKALVSWASTNGLTVFWSDPAFSQRVFPGAIWYDSNYVTAYQNFINGSGSYQGYLADVNDIISSYPGTVDVIYATNDSNFTQFLDSGAWPSMVGPKAFAKEKGFGVSAQSWCSGNPLPLYIGLSSNTPVNGDMLCPPSVPERWAQSALANQVDVLEIESFQYFFNYLDLNPTDTNPNDIYKLSIIPPGNINWLTAGMLSPRAGFIFTQLGILNATQVPSAASVEEIFALQFFQVVLNQRMSSSDPNIQWHVNNMHKIGISADLKNFVSAKAATGSNYSNSEYIQMLFRTLLLRDPDVATDAGYLYYLTQLNNGVINRSTAVDAIAKTPEGQSVLSTAIPWY